jgi:hypothetical protein
VEAPPCLAPAWLARSGAALALARRWLALLLLHYCYCTTVNCHCTTVIARLLLHDVIARLLLHDCYCTTVIPTLNTALQVRGRRALYPCTARIPTLNTALQVSLPAGSSGASDEVQALPCACTASAARLATALAEAYCSTTPFTCGREGEREGERERGGGVEPLERAVGGSSCKQTNL